MSRLFNVCIARSTAPVPVCILGLQYSISIFFNSQTSLYSSEMKAPPLSVFIFSGSPYKLKFCIRKFSTFIVSADLQIFAVGHLLNLSIAIRNWNSLFHFSLFTFPEESIGISCPGSVNVLVFRIRVSVIGISNSYQMPCRPHNFCFFFNLFLHIGRPEDFGFRYRFSGPGVSEM